MGFAEKPNDIIKSVRCCDLRLLMNTDLAAGAESKGDEEDRDKDFLHM